MSSFSDFTGILIGLLFVVIVFLTAMKHGVVKILASGFAAAFALVIFYAGLNLLPDLAKTLLDIDLTWKASAGVSAGLAFLVYVISRVILGLVFKSVFNPDGWFHWAVDGIPGAILSLFPSAVVLFFLFNCIRVAGTVQELNYIDSLSRDGISEMGGRIPPYPLSSTWRNGIESVPFVAPALDLIDPFSHRGNRNAAALALASTSNFLKPYLLTRPETAVLVEMPVWEQLSTQPGVAKAVQKLDRLALVIDPAVQSAAADPVISGELRRLVLRPAVDAFVASIEPAPEPVVPELPDTTL
jgi:hypothetical protein